MKILLVGIDGLRFDIALASGVADNLVALRHDGHYAPMEMEVPTISGPGWASILTGTTHAQHGIVDNTFIGSRLARHPDLLSRAFYADQTTTTFAAAGWPPLVDPAGPGPVVFRRVEQERAELHQVVCRDGETYGYRCVDDEIATIATRTLQDHGPDVSFVYFCLADETAHVHGAVSPQYRDAIARVDHHLGMVMAAVASRAEVFGEPWLVAVTTDHGHVDAGGHGGSTPEERASFVLAKTFNGEVTHWPTRFSPNELAPFLLEQRSEGQ